MGLRNVAIFKMLNLKTDIILKNALYLFLLIIFIRLLIRELYRERGYVAEKGFFKEDQRSK